MNNIHSIRMIHNRGTIQKIGEITSQFGKKALLVTGKNSVKRSGLLDRVTALLQEAQVDFFIFDEVIPNPTTNTVHSGAQLLQEHQCDVVIGIGGGSTIDSAKCIAFMGKNSGNISDYIFNRKTGIDAFPIIAIPTTAGTGTEGNSLAVLTNPDSNDKKSLKSPLLYPKVSIVDPELMQTLPKNYIASCGFDAFSHCFEAYIAKRSTDESSSIALKGITMLAEYLPIVYKDPKNIDAWENVAYASTLGGMAIDLAGVTLPHGLEHPLSGLLNITHGEGLAALYLSIMKHTSSVILEEKYKRFCKAMGCKSNKSSISDDAIEILEAFLIDLNLTYTLSDLNVKKEHIDWCVDNAVKTMEYAISNHPSSFSKEELKEIYIECL